MRKIFTLVSAVAIGMMCANATVTTTPVKIKSGFNQDVICEDVANVLTNTTQSDVAEVQGIDGGGAVYYTTGVQAEGALCAADGVFYSARYGVKYQIDPTANNGLVLKLGKAEGGLGEGTLEFETAQKAKSIYVVATSADGDSNLDITVNYKDGTSVNSTLTVYNWDTAGHTDVASVTGLGRLFSKAGWAGDAGTIQGGYAFNLYESGIDVDNTKEIVSVTVAKTTNSTCCCVFGVSISDASVADTTPDTTAVESIETADDVVAVEYYGVNGQKLSAPVQGINIVKYSDGTVRKEIVR